MKHFTHPQVRQAMLARCTLPESNRLYNYVRTSLGQVFNIVKVEDCTVKKANSSYKCGSDPNCPGRILLDRPPFNEESRCYCWQDPSIFDFLEE